MSNYKSRKVGRTEVNGIIVSTAYTNDEGYETAILDAKNAYPVERYKTKEDAEKGHEKWCIEAKTLTRIKRLGGFGGLVEDEEIDIIRRPSA